MKNGDNIGEEEKLLLTITLKNDKLMNNFLTPGEFISLLDKAKLKAGSRPPQVEEFLIEAKLQAHKKYISRLESVLLRLAELLAEVENSTELSGTLVGKKQDRTMSGTTLASTHQMTGFTYSAGKSSNLLHKLSPNELEYFKREREELVQIHPELREVDEDLETHQIDGDDTGSAVNPEYYRLGTTASTKTFDSQANKFRPPMPADVGYEVALPMQRLREFRANHGGDSNHNHKGNSYGDLGKTGDSKTFSKTASGFRVTENKASLQDKRGPVNGKHTIKIKDADEDYDPHRDYDSQRVEAPMRGQIRPRSNDYRIKRASKSSGGPRPPLQSGGSGIPKVSPYAQPMPGELERRRRLQKLT